MRKILAILALAAALLLPQSTSTDAAPATACSAPVFAPLASPPEYVVATFTGELLVCQQQWTAYMSTVNRMAVLLSASYNTATNVTTLIFAIRTNVPSPVCPTPAFQQMPNPPEVVVATFTGELLVCLPGWAAYMAAVNGMAVMHTASYNTATNVTTLIFALR